MKNAKKILILSGEGDGPGSFEPFYGRRTLRALRRRLKKERAGGDRWARAIVVPESGPAWVINEETGELVDYAEVPKEV